MGFNIAIDGPAGAGKSTIAKGAAARLQFIYVDTGAMYRAIGLYMYRIGADMENPEEIERHVEETDVSIAYRDSEQQVFLNGENVSGLIRTEQVGWFASEVSKCPGVRRHLLGLQRRLAANADVLMDGRDIGTCVLPEADVKIYLTADVAVRAERRCKELEKKGVACSPEEIAKQIAERDYQDMHRETSPLRQAEDAVLLDTSQLTIEEAIEAVVSLAEKKRSGKAV